ncbi:NAD(P)-dependent alcohol dehydrogenase [Streptomyces sp. NBC_00158]|uniref:NAD(P)-dependent alcohol dehydrogenase n=1 Tax=Streptomyces sp. NBC_00158 TaxID=2903627 RepID=UPI002F9128E1
MQAAVVDRYGAPDVVRIGEVPRPAPRKGEVLVRVRAVAVTSADSRIRGARFPSGFGPFARLAFGLFRPRRPVLGSAFSGEVAAVGPHVGDVAPGDEVCGMTGIRMGAHAEYVVVPAKKLAPKPPAVSHDDAAAVLFGGSTALFFLRDKASLGPGTSVCVNGASGAIGTNAVQLARHLGATVTAVTSTPNTALVAGLGAERVIDYTREDLSTLPDRFDVVLDTVGNLSIASGRRLLNPGGVLLLAVADLGETVRARGDVVAGTSPERAENFAYLLRLVADGVLTVVIDRTYDLRDIAEAHRRVDSGRKTGNIVVRP